MPLPPRNYWKGVVRVTRGQKRVAVGRRLEAVGVPNGSKHGEVRRLLPNLGTTEMLAPMHRKLLAPFRGFPRPAMSKLLDFNRFSIGCLEQLDEDDSA